MCTKTPRHGQQAIKAWHTDNNTKLHAVLALLFGGPFNHKADLQAVLQSLGSFSLFWFAPVY